MHDFDWNWLIGCVTVTIIVSGFVIAINMGSRDSNEKYYDSMNRCIAAGGSFIPMRGSDAICLQGNKQ